jgi:hypothetical protein
VERQRALRLVAGKRLLVELVLQDRGDAVVGQRSKSQGSRAGALESIGWVLLRQPEDPQATLEALLRVDLRP